eukprot:TRINITY_DN11720_c0_g2_i1.p1 TRINITY_DN11720_c0_g2~~TRINITY_DN11720_c0_g2_i1.p1  ORF type:complete len:666 (+),score=195.58 TRINITY_DN11720_c0_g2_i1:52-1998(+)
MRCSQLSNNVFGLSAGVCVVAAAVLSVLTWDGEGGASGCIRRDLTAMKYVFHGLLVWAMTGGVAVHGGWFCTYLAVGYHVLAAVAGAGTGVLAAAAGESAASAGSFLVCFASCGGLVGAVMHSRRSPNGEVVLRVQDSANGSAAADTLAAVADAASLHTEPSPAELLPSMAGTVRVGLPGMRSACRVACLGSDRGRWPGWGQPPLLMLEMRRRGWDLGGAADASVAATQWWDWRLCAAAAAAVAELLMSVVRAAATFAADVHNPAARDWVSYLSGGVAAAGHEAVAFAALMWAARECVWQGLLGCGVLSMLRAACGVSEAAASGRCGPVAAASVLVHAAAGAVSAAAGWAAPRASPAAFSDRRSTPDSVARWAAQVHCAAWTCGAALLVLLEWRRGLAEVADAAGSAAHGAVMAAVQIHYSGYVAPAEAAKGLRTVVCLSALIAGASCVSAAAAARAGEAPAAALAAVRTAANACVLVRALRRRGERASPGPLLRPRLTRAVGLSVGAVVAAAAATAVALPWLGGGGGGGGLIPFGAADSLVFHFSFLYAVHALVGAALGRAVSVTIVRVGGPAILAVTAAAFAAAVARSAQGGAAAAVEAFVLIPAVGATVGAAWWCGAAEAAAADAASEPLQEQVRAADCSTRSGA